MKCLNKLKYFDISWISSVDGPGTRVVLFLQGCHLRCPWCHSPHSWEIESSLFFFECRCQLCGRCVDSCPSQIHKITNGTHLLDRSNCIKCGVCIENCPSSNAYKWNTSALGFTGKTMEVSELYHLLKPQLELLRSIGGLTVSGGDPLLQSEALAELLEICVKEGIHTTVETSATVDKKYIEDLLPFVDNWLIGLRPSKVDKPEDWKQLLENIEFLATHNPQSIIIRTPIIPEFTDTQLTYDTIIEIMQHNSLKSIEILPYNPYSENYYKAMGLKFSLGGTQSPSNDEMARIKHVFTTVGIDAKIVN